MKRGAAAALVFTLGLFALVAQTLLLRAYLGALEGSEIAIGSFFGSWLLHVALGAVLARALLRGRLASIGAFAWCCLLYLPAFVLQHQLTAHARDLFGVPVYEVFPLDLLLGASLLLNAPLSLLTGFLFTFACRTKAAGGAEPVARVWILECMGGFAGGLLVTLLLSAGLEAATVFGLAALPLALAAALTLTLPRMRRARPSRRAPLFSVLAFLPALLLLAGLGLGLDAASTGRADRAAWSRLLPAAAFRGTFTTPQARYLHGVHEDVVHIVSWGVVSTAVPDPERGGEIAALHLAQVPHAKHILVMGDAGPAVALVLASLPQVEHVALFHPDPAFPRALWDVLPEESRRSDKILLPDEDLREHLLRVGRHYDLVLLALPHTTTLVANRYATREFLRRVAAALAPGGVASLRVPAGENVIGDELAHLGASALVTMESVFPEVTLRPGEESWLLASRDPVLSSEPAVLRDRFRSVVGADAIFPVEAVPSLYLPDRIAFQTTTWRDVARTTGEEHLLNTEDKPKGLLFGLLFSLRRAGRAGFVADLPRLLETGAWILGAGLVLLALLRVLYLLTRPRRFGVPSGSAPGSSSSFDAGFLVFSTGWAAMALALVWMFAYQARFGSLFLDVGLVSSLVMLGLFLGGLASARCLKGRTHESAWLLPSFLLLGVLVLVLPLWIAEDAPRGVYAMGLLATGFAMGLFFPVAAARLRRQGRSSEASGALLAGVDHLGGALGAAATGLLLLPLFGLRATVVLIALLVAVNLPSFLAARWIGGANRGALAPQRRADAALRAAGWVAAGLVLLTLVGSAILRADDAERTGERVEARARHLVGAARLEPLSTPARGEAARPIGFRVLDTEGRESGWVFDTSALAPDVEGYGGRLALVAHVDTQGRLLGFDFVDSRETPAYVDMLTTWRGRLVGRDLFAANPFDGVDAVTGATVTSNAVLLALESSGRAFARDVLGRPVPGRLQARASVAWLDLAVLLLLLAGGVVLRWFPSALLRRLWLVAVLVTAGLWLNAQYSSQHVFTLLRLEWPLVASTAFVMVLVVPVFVLLFGNVYCGWACPFGAAQELLGDIGRRRWDTDPHDDVWRWGRAVKYGLLALLLLAVLLSGRTEVLSADPLVTLFSGNAPGTALTLAVLGLLLSLVFGRFFCRAICPAGAFLALLNRARLLRRWLPTPRTGRCDLGVRHHHELDCLCCDRCRHDA